MIRISEIRKIDIGSKVRLEATIAIDENKRTMFFETDSCYKELILEGMSDPFIVAILPYALLHGHNIVLDKPMSTKLYEGIVDKLIPALLSMNSQFKSININSELAFVKTKSSAAATGISCGIDSFYTVLSCIEDEARNLKYLTYFNSIHDESKYDSVREDNTIITDRPLKVAKELGLDFIYVLSNVNSFLSDFGYEQIHTLSNMSHALMLQGLISDYYYSTAFPESKFKLDFTYSGNYDFLTQEAIRTESFNMISYGGNATRVDKTKLVSGYDIAKKYLDVCLDTNVILQENRNCSKCIKCIRTMVTLDALNKLSEFDEVFDINEYNQNKSEFWADIVYRKLVAKSIYSEELLEYCREKKYKIPMSTYLHVFMIGFRNQFDKLKRKLNYESK